jgi:hypothetical protein
MSSVSYWLQSLGGAIYMIFMGKFRDIQRRFEINSFDDFITWDGFVR